MPLLIPAAFVITIVALWLPGHPQLLDNAYTEAFKTGFIGILLAPLTQISLPADTWIEVRGKLHAASYKGKEIMQITPETIIPVPQPSTPYVYTSPDSVAAWQEIQQNGIKSE
ncbi:hypothetical protein [Paenibacillus sp. S150]|uniref:TIGR03943 family putative permease subunit n=1 Tax=Paenibacillus sp. S150 TaxID=2749826 RepID=UPI001C580BD7|nr:hypothetical protein [Paenibacillus sp. S150]MBW4085002.1 hypothetical protein [Paenibacillus sp. S150]